MDTPHENVAYTNKLVLTKRVDVKENTKTIYRGEYTLRRVYKKDCIHGGVSEKKLHAKRSTHT